MLMGEILPLRSRPFKDALASHFELGHIWHVGGRRRWAWADNGADVNGFIEFETECLLMVYFPNRWFTGTWEKKSNGDILVTFGNYEHTLRMEYCEYPTFTVIKRYRLDGGCFYDRWSWRSSIGVVMNWPSTVGPCPLDIREEVITEESRPWKRCRNG